MGRCLPEGLRGILRGILWVYFGVYFWGDDGIANAPSGTTIEWNGRKLKEFEWNCMETTKSIKIQTKSIKSKQNQSNPNKINQIQTKSIKFKQNQSKVNQIQTKSIKFKQNQSNPNKIKVQIKLHVFTYFARAVTGPKWAVSFRRGFGVYFGVYFGYTSGYTSGRTMALRMPRAAPQSNEIGGNLKRMNGYEQQETIVSHKRKQHWAIKSHNKQHKTQ